MRRVLLGLVVLVVFGASARAESDDAGQARIHFERGRRYFQVDELAKAIDEFKAAYVAKPDPAFLYNIAECYRKLGENSEALTFYRRFMVASSPTDRGRPTARRRIAELEARGDLHPGSAPMPLAPPPGPPPPPLVAPTEPVATVERDQPEPAPQPAAPSRPFYRRGWFYVTLGVVVAAGAAGVWALSSRGGTEIPDTPLGNQRIFPQ